MLSTVSEQNLNKGMRCAEGELNVHNMYGSIKNSTEKNARITFLSGRKKIYTRVLQVISRGCPSALTDALVRIADRCVGERNRVSNHRKRSAKIFLIDFSFNFNRFTKLDCLEHFKFKKRDVQRLVSVIVWPEYKTKIIFDIYAVTPLLAKFILLRRLDSPC